MNTDGYMLNGVLVTVYRQWAVNLMKREAKGESLPNVSKTGWREALGYAPDADARTAVESVRAAA